MAPIKYFQNTYDTKERFCSYWHQIDEIRSLAPKNILEVGVGNGFVSGYLRQRGLAVTTLDIDSALNPDLTGSVLQIPFCDNSFEAVACFEVLEHLPYSDFPRALNEIRRVCGESAVISLPDWSRAYRVNIQIPKIGDIKWLMPVPQLRLPERRFDGEHYWNIGTRGYPLKKITEEMRNAGFRIEKTYRVFENPWHRFFVLKKKRK